MINIIWAVLILSGFIVGAINGNIQEVTDAAIANAETAVNIALGLIGIMTLWLGIMKVAEEAGIVKGLARLISPVTKKLFSDVPADHPARGAIVMNLAANILGLGNAATPLGLKAMQELQKLNNKKDTATDAMVMFLAINTSSVTLIPATTIGILSSAGGTNPTNIIGPTIIATTVSTAVAIIACKLLGKLPKYQLKHDEYSAK
ncbi:MAG: nucleoside recognition protein [Tissierellia bacterium]|nr:nucleoside recognition protein [Tissierellia bacterium]